MSGRRALVMTPSMYPQARHRERIDQGIRLLSDAGCRVVHGSSRECLYMGGTVGERVSQFRALTRERFDIGISCVGGKAAIQLLPHLPYDSLAASRPAIIGYSDTTTILLANWKRAGLIGFHYPDLAGGFADDEHWTMSQLESVFGDPARFAVAFQSSNYECIQEGAAAGQLLGGNLSAMSRLVGTDYLPDLSGAVVFVESYERSVAEVGALFEHLRLAGVLGQIGGLVLGSFTKADEEIRVRQWPMDKVLMSWVGAEVRRGIPIIRTSLIGHCGRNLMLPIGLRVSFCVGVSSATMRAERPCAPSAAHLS